MAGVSLALGQAKVFKSSWGGGITFKYKEIGGLNLDPNLQHKYFKVIAQFGTHSVTILYLEDEEPGNI